MLCLKHILHEVGVQKWKSTTLYTLLRCKCFYLQSLCWTAHPFFFLCCLPSCFSCYLLDSGFDSQIATRRPVKSFHLWQKYILYYVNHLKTLESFEALASSWVLLLVELLRIAAHSVSAASGWSFPLSCCWCCSHEVFKSLLQLFNFSPAKTNRQCLHRMEQKLPRMSTASSVAYRRLRATVQVYVLYGWNKIKRGLLLDLSQHSLDRDYVKMSS